MNFHYRFHNHTLSKLIFILIFSSCENKVSTEIRRDLHEEGGISSTQFMSDKDYFSPEEKQLLLANKKPINSQDSLVELERIVDSNNNVYTAFSYVHKNGYSFILDTIMIGNDAIIFNKSLKKDNKSDSSANFKPYVVQLRFIGSEQNKVYYFRSSEISKNDLDRIRVHILLGSRFKE